MCNGGIFTRGATGALISSVSDVPISGFTLVLGNNSLFGISSGTGRSSRPSSKLTGGLTRSFSFSCVTGSCGALDGFAGGFCVGFLKVNCNGPGRGCDSDFSPDFGIVLT